MLSFSCKLFGHNFKYIRRYYRCTRCGVRKYDLSKARQARMMGENPFPYHGDIGNLYYMGHEELNKKE